MGIKRYTEVLYGVRVPDDTDWLALDDDPGQFNALENRVGYMRAGAFDRDMTFLVTAWQQLEPGQFHLVPAIAHNTAESFHARTVEEITWNKMLTATAERLGLEIIDGPGWFTIADES